MFVSAIVVAGGLGLRMKTDRPKQFLKIGSKYLIQHTLEKINEINIIDEVVLTLPLQNYDKWNSMVEELIEKMNLKVDKIVKGGEKRQNSVYNGFKNCNPCADIILIHDAVRPFFETDLVKDAIAHLKNYDGVIFAVPISDTVKKIDSNKVITETLDRKELFRAQTPQIFKRDVLEKSFDYAFESNREYTDESSMAEEIGARIRIIESSEKNIKITKPDDIKLAEFLLGNFD
ncbi:MAG: 2-C-methyl-D-erythritol 4-phosphate cytidylyltransferase [Candidatus Schekmanbacteria bacterium]|nr:MAG: 2-C-methyl-D-erythritol 4-phosphate cytidylyltransferase [Candidatus Schekmanbacteria bacterium]